MLFIKGEHYLCLLVNIHNMIIEGSAPTPFPYRYTSGNRFGAYENYICYYNNHRVQRNFGVLTPMEKYNLYLVA